MTPPDPPDPIPTSGDLEATLRTPSGEEHRATIVLVSNEHVRLALPPSCPLDVDPGAALTLIFKASGGDELAAKGRLTEEERTATGERRMDFRFEHPGLPARTSMAAPETSPGDNRRNAFRVKADQGEMGIILRPYGNAELSVLRQLMALRVHGTKRTVNAWVFDVAAEGVGVMVDADDAHVFKMGEHVDLSFELPEGPGPLLLGAVVRHRKVVRAGTRYGLSFDLGTSAHFQLAQAAILEFVMRRQRDHLRHKAG
jgi:PilZ domain-containing protein